MKFKALSTFVIFNGQMNVFNAGDEGDLPEDQIAGYIANGKAEPVIEKKGRAKAATRAAADDAPAAPVADADAPPA